MLTYAVVCCRMRTRMLTYAGEKVYASEVEGALLSHALVAQAAVVGVPDARLGQYRGLLSLSIED